MVSRVSHDAKSGMWGEVELTQGNLNPKNSHFYMRGFLDRFPADLKGGSSDSKTAPAKALVDWGGPSLVETDIDGEDKHFFRKRGWVRKLFEREKAEPGDWVRVEETAPYRYRVTIIKKASR
jgi:hypothetical protein